MIVKNDNGLTKYVYLEVVLSKGQKYDVTSGLFRGYTDKDGVKFLLLGKGKTTNCVNLQFYNVLMLEELKSDYRNMTFFTADKKDQETALEMVISMHKALKEAGYSLPNDENVFDIDKFAEVPKEYLDEFDSVKPGTVTQKFYVSNNVVSTVKPAAAVTYTYQKKEPTPFVIKPSDGDEVFSAQTMAVLIEKIASIMEGNYVAQLPDIKGVDESGVSSNSGGEDDELGNYRGVYGYGYGQ